MLLTIAAEAAYAAGQKRELRVVTEDAPVLLAHCDGNRRYRFVNRAYAERFGLDRGQIIGRSMIEIVGPDRYELFRPYVDAALRGERVEFELQVPYDRLGPRVMRCSYVPDGGTDDAAGFILV